MELDKRYWRDSAACSSLSLVESEDLFFPGHGKKSLKAQKFCDNNHCPVKTECIISATLNSEVGIWGGTTEKERKSWYASKNARLMARVSAYEDIRKLA